LKKFKTVDAPPRRAAKIALRSDVGPLDRPLPGQGRGRRAVHAGPARLAVVRPTSTGFAMVVKAGGKEMEFSPGKSAIAVEKREHLGDLMTKLIAAAKAGEFDELLAKAVKPVGQKKPTKKAA
jgi:hypothetical protein